MGRSLHQYSTKDTKRWRVTAIVDNSIVEKSFHDYRTISNDPVFNKVIRNKDHFYNIRKRNNKKDIKITKLY